MDWAAGGTKRLRGQRQSELGRLEHECQRVREHQSLERREPRFFPKLFVFSRCALAGVFAPTVEHFPDLIQMLGKQNILFIVKHLYFPRYLQKEFKNVQFILGFIQIRQFLLSRQITCYE